MPTQERFHGSEEGTKLRRITPAIQADGWKSDQMLMEYPLKTDRNRIIADQNCTFKEKRPVSQKCATGRFSWYY